jgi:aryl-alcohol dehydrogenase-like predicted oxidoreductase
MGRSIGRDSFRYLLDLPFNGVILSGTKSREHLRDNIAAFHAA